MEMSPGGNTSYRPQQLQSNDKRGSRLLPAELLLLPRKGKNLLLKLFPDLHFQDAIAAGIGIQA